MEPTNTSNKNTIIGIAVAVVVIVAIILIAVFAGKNKAPAETTDTANTDTTTTETTGTTAAPKSDAGLVKPGTKIITGAPIITPTVTSIIPVSTSATATSGTNDGTNHGTFTVTFSVYAEKDKGDIYFNPSCQIGTPGKNGVTFSLIKDGAATISEVGPQSCVVLTSSTEAKTAKGNHRIAAGTSKVFQLVVVSHPTASGDYKVKVTGVGYATTDSNGTTFFPLSSAQLSQMVTKSLAL